MPSRNSSDNAKLDSLRTRCGHVADVLKVAKDVMMRERDKLPALTDQMVCDICNVQISAIELIADLLAELERKP